MSGRSLEPHGDREHMLSAGSTNHRLRELQRGGSPARRPGRATIFDDSVRAAGCRLRRSTTSSRWKRAAGRAGRNRGGARSGTAAFRQDRDGGARRDPQVAIGRFVPRRSGDRGRHHAAKRRQCLVSGRQPMTSGLARYAPGVLVTAALTESAGGGSPKSTRTDSCAAPHHSYDRRSFGASGSL